MKSDSTSAIVPRIFDIRGESVMLDSDLATLYGVETKVFNQAIKRNVHRFPSDFAFQLQREEFAILRSQIVTSSSPGGRRYQPWVFTEHGAIMAATILNSERAVAMSVFIVRAFVKMRTELLADATLEARLQKIEKTLLNHDSALREVIQQCVRCSCLRRTRRNRALAFTRISHERLGRPLRTATQGNV